MSETAEPLATSMATVTRSISYLRSVVGPVELATNFSEVPDEGSFVACDALVAHPDWLAHIVRATGERLGTSDDMVAASLFVQSYAYRLATLAIASLTTSGILPDSSLSSCAVSFSRGRVTTLAYPTGAYHVVAASSEALAETLCRVTQLDVAHQLLSDQVLDGHLRPLIVALRGEIRVGERLLWGNVASSFAVGFRTMEGVLGPWVQILGNYFVERAPSYLTGMGQYFNLEVDERRGWFWERTNCCLYDRLPGNVRCQDCSRTPQGERRDAYRASLTSP